MMCCEDIKHSTWWKAHLERGTLTQAVIVICERTFMDKAKTVANEELCSCLLLQQKNLIGDLTILCTMI